MKILHINNINQLDIPGGSQKIALELALATAKIGHQVHLVSGSAKVLKPTLEIKGNLHLHLWPIHTNNILSCGLATYWRTYQIIKNLHQKEHFDLFIMHHTFSDLPAFLLAKNKDLPKTILHYYGPTYQEWSYETSHRPETLTLLQSLKPLLMVPICKWLYYNQAYSLRKASKVIALSHYSAREIQNLFKIKPEIKIIPGGVDEKKFQPTQNKTLIRKKLHLKPDRPIILSIRRLAARMGLERLILAMPILLKSIPKVQLIIGGKGPYESYLKQIIEANKLTEVVLLTGFISEDDLPLYYQAADLFILPSLGLEGFGLATIEALACGLPVLGSPYGATPEILKEVVAPLALIDQDLILNIETPESIAKAITKALSEPEQLKSWSSRGRALVLKKYSWKKVLQQHLELYEELLHKI